MSEMITSKQIAVMDRLFKEVDLADEDNFWSLAVSLTSNVTMFKYLSRSMSNRLV